MEQTDEQWRVPELLIPEPSRQEDGKGRTAMQLTRGVGRHLVDTASRSVAGRPARSVSTTPDLHRRFQEWVRSGVFDRVLQALVYDLEELGDTHLSECFMDGTFVVAKMGPKVGKTKRGKGTKIMVTTDDALVHSRDTLKVLLHMKSPLLQTLSEHPMLVALPRGSLETELMTLTHLTSSWEIGIDIIAPHRRNRKKPKTQDGRKLRPYKRSWKVERFFAWLYNFRKVVVRYERRGYNFASLVKLGCIVILSMPVFEMSSRNTWDGSTRFRAMTTSVK